MLDAALEATRRVRRTDPSTSVEAAHMIAGTAMAHADRIRAVLATEPNGLGAEEIAARTGLQAYQVRKRLPEMAKQGWVMLTGEERKTELGRTERVWEALF
jgi:predicted ArsR family transcriptional regulator